MAKIKNKIIPSVLVPALLMTSSFPATIAASNNFWGDSVYTNFVTPAAATDPNTGITYYSGGNINVRFKALNDFPPIAIVQGPELKVGCSGVSFNLGFASLINFKQLSQQLSQAGASLAWGLLIGLAYSLPALKQVFDTINDWSAKIQDMLSNSCYYGKALSKKWVDDNINYDREWLSTKINDGLKAAIPKRLEGASESFYETLREGGATDNDKNGLVSKDVDVFLKDYSGGVTSAYLTNLVKENKELNVKFPSVSGSSSYTKYAFKTVNLEDSGFSRYTVVSVYVLLSLVSDIKLSNKAFMFVSEFLEASGSGDNEKIAKAKKDFDTFVSQNKGTQYLNYLHSTDKDTGNAVDFLLNGKNSTFNKRLKGEYQPTLRLITRKYPDGKLEHMVLLGGRSEKKINEDVLKWEGVKTSSAKTISYIASTVLARMHNTAKPIIPANAMPVLVPNKIDLIQNVLVLKKPADTNITINEGVIKYSDPDIATLLNNISNINALQGTNLILSNIMNGIAAKNAANFKAKNGGKAAVSADTTASSELTKIKKKLAESIKEQKEFIEKSMKKYNESVANIVNEIKIEKRSDEMLGQ